MDQTICLLTYLGCCLPPELERLLGEDKKICLLSTVAPWVCNNVHTAYEAYGLALNCPPKAPVLKAWLLLVMLLGVVALLRSGAWLEEVSPYEHDLEECVLSLGLCSLSPAAMGLAFYHTLLPQCSASPQPWNNGTSDQGLKTMSPNHLSLPEVEFLKYFCHGGRRLMTDTRL